MKIHLGDKYIEPQTQGEFDNIITALSEIKFVQEEWVRIHTEAEAKDHLAQWAKDWNKN